MGLQKASSKVMDRKKSQVEACQVEVIKTTQSSASRRMIKRTPKPEGKTMLAGPAHKKVSAKTRAPVKAGSQSSKGNTSHMSHSAGKNHEGKTPSKSKSSQAAIASALKKSGRGLLDAGSDTVCREVACEGLATSGGYCRLHYIKNWKKIKRKEMILREKKLNQYIEELVAKYPDKYIEAIRQDLANDKDFAKVIYDLDLDEGVDDFDVEGSDSVDSLIDTIKRDFDDEGDAF